MKLTRKQKRFVKTHIKTHAPHEIAEKIGVSENDVRDHLKTTLRKEKYKKVVSSTHTENASYDTPYIPGRMFSFLSFLKSEWVFLLVLVVLSVGVYANGLHNDFVSDDVRAIVENHRVGSFKAAVENPPYLLWSLTQATIFQLDGANPFYFRIFNVVFHSINVVLMYAVLSLLTKRSIARIAAAIFAVHPILTESVTWISGGVYALYTVFVLLGLLLYILYDKKNKRAFLIASLFSFVIALITSEKSAMFPLLISAYVLGFGSIRERWKSLVPFYILTGAFALLLVGSLQSRAVSLQEDHYQEVSLMNPFVMVPFMVMRFLQLIVVPIGLTFYHGGINTEVPVAIALFILFMIFLAVAYYGYKHLRILFFGMAFFIISLSPVLVPINLSAFVAERYVYLGSIGIILCMALLLDRVSALAEEYKKPALILVTIGVVLLFSYLTIQRNTDWKNEEALAAASMQHGEEIYLNRNNLGIVHFKKGEYDKAIEEFEKALELNPRYADAYLNMANAYKESGRIEEAREVYRQSLEMNPKLWQSHFGLSVIAFEENDLALAAEELEKAIDMQPERPQLLNNLATIYLQMGNTDRAAELLEESLEINPNDENVRQLYESIQ